MNSEISIVESLIKKIEELELQCNEFEKELESSKITITNLNRELVAKEMRIIELENSRSWT